MKITPLEIRQKTFEKVFRGVDKDEVNAFLVTMSQEWERLIDENKELKIRLESSEKEVEKLREVENSLFKTLKTAEDTGANMIDQANKTAALHLRESQINADAMINDAKIKARDMMEQAELHAKGAVDDMEERVRHLAQVYRNLENMRDDLISDIRTFANDTLEKTERVKSQIKAVDIEGELMKIKRESVDKTQPFATIPEPQSQPVAEEPVVEEPTLFVNKEENTIAEEPEPERKKTSSPGSEKSTSFFDDLE